MGYFYNLTYLRVCQISLFASSTCGSSHILHRLSVLRLPTCTCARFSWKSVLSNRKFQIIFAVIYNNTLGIVSNFFCKITTNFSIMQVFFGKSAIVDDISRDFGKILPYVWLKTLATADGNPNVTKRFGM